MSKPVTITQPSKDQINRPSEKAEDYHLLLEAQKRLENNIGKKGLSFDEVMNNYEITKSDIENAQDLDIE